jgi:hypothetical protein
VSVFGRVPFFYYVLHIPLTHAPALGVSLIRLGQVGPWLFANHPMGNPPLPEGYTWGLGLQRSSRLNHALMSGATS